MFVSAAAGVVGSTVVRSLGADAVVDYKSGGALTRKLIEVAPHGIEVYFDNVGGKHLDGALAAANQKARFAIRGMIDIYNSSRPTELSHLAKVTGARIRIQGFLVSDHLAHVGDFYRDMGGWLAEGDLRGE